MSLIDEMQEDAAAEKAAPVASDKLDMLTKYIQRMKICEEEVEKAEAALEEKKKTLSYLSEVLVPDLFDQLKLSDLKLESGEKVEIKRGYAASISEANQEECYKWLKDNGHESIIKHVLAVNLKKGENKEYETIKEVLLKEGVSFADKEAVHDKTLKSFVNEQMTNGSGKDFPQKLFNVFPLRKTKISKTEK